ncbi:anthrone oxygenase family protein [Nocardia sp. NPDC001965]
MTTHLEAPPTPTGDTRRIAALRFTARLFAGSFAGFLLGVLVLESSLRTADAAGYTLVRSVELDRLDVLASVTLLPALGLGAALAVAAYRSHRTWLPIAVAVALLAAVAIVSVTVNLPVNAQQATWLEYGIPADWSAVRDRWQTAHTVRTAAAMVAFGLLLLPPRSRIRAH